ncbi:hypothetical protein AAFM71_00615 [Chromobacterium violaceum]|uniref:COG4315 family predicted lipoprotein n=1 Tax=Chromobacterium violaceum TaxID=536 RepID=UPI00385DBA46
MDHALLLAGFLAILAAAPASAGPSPIIIRDGALADPSGMTLYVFAKDKADDGRSACNGPCATLWPPLAAGVEDKPEGSLGLAVRDDDSRQWTWRGKPLYRFAQDRAPGERKGDGFKQLWQTAKP